MKLPTKANVWNGREMVHPESPPTPNELSPGWLSVTCWCCGGLEWGGEYPTEHDECGGNGHFWVHAATGTGALWPGGPFNGRHYDPSDCARYTEQAS